MLKKIEIIANMKNIYLLICFVLVFVCCSATLPKYVKTCKRNDPGLNKCLVEQGNVIIPIIVKGDKRMRIPPLNPLHLDELNVIDTPNLKLKLTQVLVHGLPEVHLLSLDLDIAKKHGKAKVIATNLTIVGHYTINGQILILPIAGEGQATINTDAEAIFQFDYDLVKKNNKEYMHLLETECDFVVRKNVFFALDNLFNGDKKLGDEMNKFLNDNGPQVIQEFKNPIAGTVNAVGRVILGGFFDSTPYDELLPE